jgi:OOP family OmpA-OmpF porin
LLAVRFEGTRQGGTPNIHSHENTMTNATMKQATGLAAAVALALAVLSGGAIAQQAAGPPTTGANTSYLRDTSGNVPLSAYGVCWRTGFGPASPAPACDPKLVAAAVVLPVEPAPVAQPAVVAAPAPVPAPVIQKLTFDADMLFDFDKSSLRPAGRATLDDFASRIKGIDPEAIKTVGHTDRVGSSEYNQRLSEQRAEAVKTYLVSIGIAAQRVVTSGKGETEPVTRAGDCPGGKSAKVISCLQPDRRVDIALVGARTPQ